MVTIAPATESDLQVTSELHVRALSSGLFPALGSRFLAHYHRTFVGSPHAVALVARDQGRTIGFVLGTADGSAHQRWVIRQHGWRLALSGLLAMLVRPRVAVTFLRTRVGRYARGLARALRPSRPASVAASGTGSTSAPAIRTAVLTHIATDRSHRGRGVGRELAESFVAQVEAEGADEARLITEAGGRAAAFYRRLGWHRVTRRRAQDGSDVEELRLTLRSGDA